MSVPTRARGYQAATGGWGGALDADIEAVPELLWPRSVQKFDQMRRQDSQVISVLRAVTLPIRRTQWWVEPNGARDEVVQHVADDLGLPITGQSAAPPPLRTRDRFSWADHLRLSLLMLPIGHSFFEQVYRIEEGRARLRKLMWLPHRTISKISVAADGGLSSVEQLATGTGADPKIDVSNLVAYVQEREGGNWLGQSILRPAYPMWWLKNRALRTQSLTIERNGLGVPVYEGAEAPDGLTGEDLQQWSEDDLTAGEDLARSFRSGDTAGGAIPHGAKLTLRGVEGTLPDADVPIRYYDEQMARAVLAHFLNLGTETGSWALGSTFADFFTLSLQTVALDVASVTTQHVIEDLVDANWGDTEPAPRLIFDEIGSRSPATAEAIKALIECGAISADEVLEHHMRTRFGLPAADADTRRAAPNKTTSSSPLSEEEQ